VFPTYFFELKRQEFFYLLFNYYQKQDLARFLHCILSKDIQFEKFVMTNYSNAKNVQELAKSANYSASGFIKKFQKCFNDSPYKWMQKQKAKQISIEINRGQKSLQEIASEYKFSSYQHFSVFCKTQLGSPPKEILSKKIEK
jgi:AraC-like DNA-binding protein